MTNIINLDEIKQCARLSEFLDYVKDVMTDDFTKIKIEEDSSGMWYLSKDPEETCKNCRFIAKYVFEEFNSCNPYFCTETMVCGEDSEIELDQKICKFFKDKSNKCKRKKLQLGNSIYINDYCMKDIKE